MVFDSAEFSWNDVRIFMLGKEVTGAQRIRFGSSQQKGLVYAKGKLPRSIQRGNVSYTGEITLLQSEVAAIRTELIAAGKTGFLWELTNFVVVVDYQQEGSLERETYKLTCQFTDHMRGMDQGQLFDAGTCPLIVGAIE